MGDPQVTKGSILSDGLMTRMIWRYPILGNLYGPYVYTNYINYSCIHHKPWVVTYMYIYICIHMYILHITIRKPLVGIYFSGISS